MSIWCNRSLITAPIWYGLCTSEALYKKELKQMRIPAEKWSAFMKSTHADATTHFFNAYGGKICVLVCISEVGARSGIQVAALLVHEAVHIWQEIKENIGEKSPSLEFEAYSIQAISQNLMEQFIEQTNRGIGQPRWNRCKCQKRKL